MKMYYNLQCDELKILMIEFLAMPKLIHGNSYATHASAQQLELPHFLWFSSLLKLIHLVQLLHIETQIFDFYDQNNSQFGNLWDISFCVTRP